jgi:hypothetical protein
MWTTFLGKHIKLSLAEIVLALIPSRICNYQFCNRHDSLTLCNTRTVTFKLVAVKIGARDLLSCIFVPVIHYSYSLFVVNLFISYHSLLIVHLFCSLFDYSFGFIFIEFCCCCSKREKNNSDPELCSGISIPLKEEVPVTCNTSSTC